MQAKQKYAAATSGLVLVAATAGIALTTGTASGDTENPQMVSGYAWCTTDQDGMCTVEHSLGSTPESVVLTPNIVGTNTQFDLNAVRYTWTDTTFTVRAMLDRNTPAAGRRGITFSFIATAKGNTPEPTPTTEYPDPTTSSATTSSEPEPTTTTTPDGPSTEPTGSPSASQ